MAQFIDYVQVEITSGDGGNGAVAWRREKYEPLGGPAGGSGGRGGSVYIQAVENLSTLSEYKYKNKFIAQAGQRGGSGKKDGKGGGDLILKVPIGTVIKDNESNREIADLEHSGDKVLVAAGGRGGRGNASFATPTLRAPYFCEPGESGIKRILLLELKLLADVGLVGMPNAGKSTLLAALTRAKPKIADYPFSTLEPNLGTVVNDAGKSFVIADIPGLIAGASEGVGLGHDFLRHIERTRLLAHIVDANSENLIEDIKTIDNELQEFNADLSGKDQIIVLNKIDLLPNEKIEEIKQLIKKIAQTRKIICLSGLTRAGIKDLLTLLVQKTSANSIQESSAEELQIPESRTWTADEKATARQDDSFEITRHKGIFYINGGRVLKHAQVVDWTNPESIQHLCKVLRAMGVVDELKKHNIEVGDQVQIGSATLSFGEEIF